jgi:folate-dependent phosphoribosylglycinamide formyltransferase PurN
MTPGPVLFLGQDVPLTRAVVHALRAELSDLKVMFEDPVPRKEFVQRRIKRLGWWTVIGQVLFAKLVSPVLRRSARARIDEIIREFDLDESELDGEVIRVSSVNSDEARAAIADVRPSVIVVTGTRIIGKKTLAVTDAPFINLHAGITPLYRGVNGAYWALAEGRPELAGTTIHFIDEGIDTGTIIEQVSFPLSPEDSWVTYPYLHIAHGLPALVKAVQKARAGELTGSVERSDLDSKLRYPPTLWYYLWHRLRRGVR